MALGWTSADLLTRFNRVAKRPTTDAITDAEKYSYLADAQREVYNDLGLRVPEAFLSAPTALTASADRKTFTFPSSGTPVYTELYPSLAAVPDNPLVEGVDFLAEHDQIRIPNDRSHAGTIYARYIATPGDIDASQEPSLEPTQARILIVYKAVEMFALNGGLRPDLLVEAESRYNKSLAKWLLYYHNQYDGQGRGAANLTEVDPNNWYRTSPDLG